jgi:hypothetical protein
MSTLDYCDATTQTGKLCKRKATCDSSKHGVAYCTQHFTNYYDPSKGKFVVNKISRVARDKTTGLPMRYVQNLTEKEKKLYKKEIEETNKYYKKTGLVKGRKDVRLVLGGKNVNFHLSKTPRTEEGFGLVERELTPYYPKGSNIKRFKRKAKSQQAKNLPKKRSSYSAEFEKRYGFKVTELDKVKKLFPDTDIKGILAKGRAAYASGSRPSVTGKGGIEAWAYARLSSTLTSGRALAVDKNLVGPLSLKVIFSKKYNK